MHKNMELQNKLLEATLNHIFGIKFVYAVVIRSQEGKERCY